MPSALVVFPASKPEWLAFHCYGTQIQWDDGLVGAVGKIVAFQAKACRPTRVPAFVPVIG